MIHRLEEVESTNAIAMQMGEAGAESGTIVVASRQTAGRGRAGRSWHSPEGGLYLSLIWRLPWPAHKAPQVTLQVATSVARAVESETGRRPCLRWPNDVLMDGKKLCGVLTELRTSGQDVDFLVIGIGVNTAPLGPDAPPVAGHIDVDGEVFFNRLVAELAQAHSELMVRGAFDREGWLSYAATIGKRVKVSPPGVAAFEGTATGVTRSGTLVVDGSEVLAGDVREVR